MRFARPAAVSLLLAGCQAGASEAIDTSATKAAIEATTANFSRWIQAGQLDSAATILAEDTFNMPPNHAAIAGRAQWLAWAKSTLTGGTYSSAPVAESRHYGDSLTVERGRYVNTFVPAPTAPKTIRAVSDTGKYVWVWKRTPDGWQIAEAIWNSDAAPKP